MHLQDADVHGAPSVGSSEFWHRPERVVASSDPDTATAQTIGIMCQHVAKSAQDEALRGTAYDAAGRFAGLSGGGNDARSLAESAFWWCKHFIKFVHHEFIIRQHLGEAGHLQGLISPDVLVQMDRPEGDCAIFSECVCAFLRVFGIPYELVTVAVNPNEPDIFSHVYCYAVMPDGSRLPLDASHGPYPGWQVPSSDVFRRQVWDANGNAVADRGSRFDGLHNYGLRGMGDAATLPDGTVIDTAPPTDFFNPTQQFGDFGNDPFGTGPGAPASSGGGFNWGSFVGNLANQWTQIGSRVIAPTTTFQRDAKGNILYTTPGGAAPPGSLLAGSSSWIWIAGAGVLALVVIGAMGKGR